MEILESIQRLLEGNSAVFLALFIISLLANLFEISGFFRERRKRTEEHEQRAKDEERLRVYEFLFEAAQESITTEEELDELRKEVARRRDVIPQLEQRIELLRLAAKKEIVTQNMSRTVADLRTGYAELGKLRELHDELGDLPDLPTSERSSIEEEIASSTLKPYELPKAVTYRALILVLVVFLLPSPADQVLVVILLQMFMVTFFEVAALSHEASLVMWVFRHQRAIGFLSCFGAWFFLLSSVERFLGMPLRLTLDAISDVYRSTSHAESFWLLEFLYRRPYYLTHILMILVALLFGRIHWLRIRDAVLEIKANDE